MNDRFRLDYRPAFDGLRAIACILVVTHHLNRLSWGKYGVDIFFVLSGFLITSLLLEEWDGRRTIRWGRFYARRALRLLPGLYAILGILALCVKFDVFPSIDSTNFRKHALAALLFGTNWICLRMAPYDLLRPTWSLAVEEQFYLVWPAVTALLLRLRKGARWLLILTCVGIALALLRRLQVATDDHPNLYWRIYLGSDTRADQLLFGCLAAQVIRSDYPTWQRCSPYLLLIGIPSFLTAAIVWNDLTAPLHITVLSASVAAVVLGIAAHSGRSVIVRALEWPPVVFVGKISYGVYLWHWFAFALSDHLEDVTGGALPSPWNEISILMGSIVLGAASFYLVERPFIAWRANIGAKTRAPQAASRGLPS